MKILAITQKVDENDDILGFFCGWLKKLAKQIDKIYVLALEGGKINLAENINLYSLDKENCNNRLINRFFKFNQVLVNLCLNKKIDVIFIHMCPEYAILAWPYAKLKNIPIVMWYAHGDTNMKLKIAHLLVNRIVTSSKDGFRLKSNKVIITSQGIDIEKFKIQNSKFKINETKKIILSVGRISPIKDYETLIKAIHILVNQKNIRELKLQIVGSCPLKSQDIYMDFLKDRVRKHNLENYVQFVGSIPYTQIHNYYQNCDLFISTSNTGSLDKSILEAMACGKVVLTCNEAFKDVLGNYSKRLMFKERNAAELAEKIVWFLHMNGEEKERLTKELRDIVLTRHGLGRLIDKLVTIFRNLTDSIKRD